MGKITGFMEFERLSEVYEAPASRLRHWREFTVRLEDGRASQQAARCMDCGIPFCHEGCPVHNVIPDWNDMIYRGSWREAWETLQATNNFPEFTGRVCPAPCEAACTLNIQRTPVGIKSIERAIIDHAWEQGWVVARLPDAPTGRRVAVVGSGPAGLACAQQLARAGHDVTVFERQSRPGGLLRYGIPDFKLDKNVIDRRLQQMEDEGVTFRTGVWVGASQEEAEALGVEAMDAAVLRAEFDAVVLAGGSENPRDVKVEGRELDGVHFAMDFLRQQNHAVAGDSVPNQLRAEGKRVLVIGGGDTGSDCVGTSNRQGAASVLQIELMPRPPEQENGPLVWPLWPAKLRTSSSHEEGGERDWAIATQAFEGENGRVTGVRAVRVSWEKDANGRMVMQEVPDSGFVIPADLVLLAAGFVSPLHNVLEAFGVAKDERGNARANTNDYHTSVEGVFASGDMRRGQSLVVWAIREGRQAAQAVDAWLQGESSLPR